MVGCPLWRGRVGIDRAHSNPGVLPLAEGELVDQRRTDRVSDSDRVAVARIGVIWRKRREHALSLLERKAVADRVQISR